MDEFKEVLLEAFTYYKELMAHKKGYEDEARDIQDALDAKLNNAKLTNQEAIRGFAETLDGLKIPVEGGHVRPALLRLSPDQVVVAVGDDRLWMVQEEGEHLYGPLNEVTNTRTCSLCGTQIYWP